MCIFYFHDQNGNIISEHIYLGLTPIGLFKNNQLYNVHTDHLGTPRVITTNSNQIVWQWNNTDPLGANFPSVSTIEYNLRFAGQYFDKESNLHYNYYRTYNPMTGKYLQPDPIGINGGLNTYNYVNGNTLSAIDPLGLDAEKYFNKNDSAYSNADDTLNFMANNKNIFWVTTHGGMFNNERVIGPGGNNFYTPQTFIKHFMNSEYYKRRIKNGQSLIIEIDACDAGNPNGTRYNASFGEIASLILRGKIVEQGLNNHVYIIAPSKAIRTNSFGDSGIPRPDWKADLFTWPFYGHWNVYEDGVENKDLQFYWFNRNNPVYNK